MNLKSVLLLIFFIIFTILCWRDYVCDIKNLCPEAGEEDIVHAHPIQFYKNSDNYLLGNFDIYSDSIVRLGQSQNIEIVGYYHKDEINTTEYENLGLARAHSLKELLINRGLDSNKISVFSTSQDLDFKDSLDIATTVVGATQIDMNSDQVQLVTHHGITEVYFPSNSDEEIESELLDSFLKELVQNSKDKKMRLQGHTDNIGDEESNKSLSLKRTYTIRDRLLELGMSEANIECIGKGSSAPKVNNSTPDNRALNRRVEITIR